jgi:hypothetical protein
MNNTIFIDDAEISRLKEDLVGEFEYLRGTVQRNYKYSPSLAGEKAFKQATLFCKANKIHPAVYMIGAMEALRGAKEKFYITYIGTKKANQAALERHEQNTTNPKDRLHTQKELLATQIIDLRRPYLEVLLDTKLNFYAWFRILATATPEIAVMKIYLEDARSEMTQDLKDYLTSQGLDTERLNLRI